MAALEEREYRSMCKKLTINEERSKLLKNLKRNKVCLASDESFILRTTGKLKVLKNKGDVQKSREQFLMLSLDLKIRDNILEGVKLRKKRNWLKSKLETTLGPRSGELRKLLNDIRKNTTRLRESLRKKNIRKVEHLKKKYGSMTNNMKTLMTKDMTDMVGRPQILDENVDVVTEGVKDPVIVVREGEELLLNSDEHEALK